MPLSDSFRSTLCTPHFGVLQLELMLLRRRRPESRSQAAALCIAQNPQAQAPGIQSC